MAARPITLLSDYGTDDEFAGVCRAVIARIAPDASVIDLTHGIRRHALGEGAFVLARALPYAAPGVHVAVVDPGVGSPRRALAVRTNDEERVLVGPDNGLLIPALESFGGPAEVVDISLSPFRLEPVSASFHGRDVFAPVAAHLASGATLSEAGEEVDAASLQPSPLPTPEFGDDGVLTQVVAVDRFGNAALNLCPRGPAAHRAASRQAGADAGRRYRPGAAVRPHVQRRGGGRGDPVRGLLPGGGRGREPG